MIKKLKDLKDQRAAIAQKMHDLVDVDEGERFSEESRAEFDNLDNEVQRLDDEITAIERVMDLEASRKFEIDRGIEQTGATEQQFKDAKEVASHLYCKFLRGGSRSFNDQDRELAAKFQNTLSTGTDSEGGYTVQKEVANSIALALKEFGGMRSVSFVMNTDNGASMDFPTVDETAQEGEILGENAPATTLDPAFGVKSLPTYKYSSKVVAVPIELLQDSNVDIESFVNGALVRRLGRITNKHFTIGTGTSQPDGVVPQSTTGKTGTTGQTTTMIYDDLVDLEHSVDPAYRTMPGVSWMMADSSLKVIKKLVDSQNRPLWLPGLIAGDPNTLMGYPYVINQDVAAMAANAKSVLFGAFNPHYIIRDAMDMTLYRFTDSAYATKGQVGFLMFMRSGGQYVDVGGAVKHYQNSAT